jgi:hypothetical protein
LTSDVLVRDLRRNIVEQNQRNRAVARAGGWAGHADASREMILAGLARLQPSSARVLVLGAGACLDVPLRELCAAGARVRLVDMDGPALGQAVQRLPSALRRQVDVRLLDVTGALDRLAGAVAPAVDTASPADLGELPDRLAGFRFDRPSFAELSTGAWDLVVSSAVLSQLIAFPSDAILSRWAARARRHAPHLLCRALEDRIADQLIRLEAETVTSHLALLADLVAPSGVVYLSTEILGPPATASTFAAARASLEGRLADDPPIGPDALPAARTAATALDPLFSVLARRTWVWEFLRDGVVAGAAPQVFVMIGWLLAPRHGRHAGGGPLARADRPAQRAAPA